MTLTLPDDPVLKTLGEQQVRIELACALYAQGKISRGVAAQLAGMERGGFDEELYRREIPSFTPEMFQEDMATLDRLFPGK
jgi:predicted HTH domain antitoxin